MKFCLEQELPAGEQPAISCAYSFGSAALPNYPAFLVRFANVIVPFDPIEEQSRLHPINSESAVTRTPKFRNNFSDVGCRVSRWTLGRWVSAWRDLAARAIECLLSGGAILNMATHVLQCLFVLLGLVADPPIQFDVTCCKLLAFLLKGEGAQFSVVSRKRQVPERVWQWFVNMRTPRSQHLLPLC